MSRKKGEIKLDNIDTIIKEIKSYTENVIKIVKLDGITMECSVIKNGDVNIGIKEIEGICKNLKLKNVCIEKNSTKENVFALQLPELEPIYTDEQLLKMYKDSFRWLIGSSIGPTEDKPTKELLYKFKDSFVKHTITIHYKSNVNQYKHKIEDYLNNVEYREKINKMFLEYVDEYLLENI